MGESALKAFFQNDFYFSYSSLKKLRTRPMLFYKEYVLGEKEDSDAKHLLMGRVLHCLLFENNKFSDKFQIISKLPSDNLVKVLHHAMNITEEKDFDSVIPEVWLEALSYVDLYSNLKEDTRVKKVKTDECKDYWNAVTAGKSIIDIDVYNKAVEKLNVLKQHTDVQVLMHYINSDFNVEMNILPEHEFKANLPVPTEYGEIRGIKGIIDLYVETDGAIHLYDLKTTSSNIAKFPEELVKYKYHWQAGLYTTAQRMLQLDDNGKMYPEKKVFFHFIVIDADNHCAVMDVSEDTMDQWIGEVMSEFYNSTEHFNKNDFSAPLEFLNKKVIL